VHSQVSLAQLSKPNSSRTPCSGYTSSKNRTSENSSRPTWAATSRPSSSYFRGIQYVIPSIPLLIPTPVLTLHTTQTRHQIDIHLAQHIFDLTNLIRNWAVVLYFQPFATIRLDRMSAAFGWTVDEVEAQVVGLIQSGDIQGRVDSQNKVLFIFFPFYQTFTHGCFYVVDTTCEKDRLSC
jgi:hypothetical protein